MCEYAKYSRGVWKCPVFIYLQSGNKKDVWCGDYSQQAKCGNARNNGINNQYMHRKGTRSAEGSFLTGHVENPPSRAKPRGRK